MKLSIYNSIIKVNDSVSILYNAYSDKFLILTNNTVDLIRSQSLRWIKENRSLIFEDLLKAKAIVSKDSDEKTLIADSIKSKIIDNERFHLHINPTVDCIFKCWYCYEEHIQGTKMKDDIKNAICRLVDSIFSTNASLKYFDLSFFGGEPLMYFSHIAKSIIDYIDEKCNLHNVKLRIHFTSNGYLLKPSIVNYLKDKECSFQITLDGYKSNHDKVRFLKSGTGSYDVIVKNIKLLAEHNIKVILRINYTADNSGELARISNDFSNVSECYRQYIKLDIQRVWQDASNKTGQEETDENVNAMIKSFRNLGYNVSYYRINNNAAYPCYGDFRNHILVNYNGDIYNCTARDFTKENRSGKLQTDGTIEWDIDVVERFSKKFSVKGCQTCRIAPICGGGCIQRITEVGNNAECTYNYSESDKDKKILDRFEFMFLNDIQP